MRAPPGTAGQAPASDRTAATAGLGGSAVPARFRLSAFAPVWPPSLWRSRAARASDAAPTTDGAADHAVRAAPCGLRVAGEAELCGLLRGGLRGDEDRYRRFLEAAARLVRALAAAEAGAGGEDVERIVRDTLSAIHAKRHTWRPDVPASAWIMAVARFKSAARPGGR